MDGHQRANSDTQLGSVDSGPTTINGPCTPLERRCDRNPIVCTCECIHNTQQIRCRRVESFLNGNLFYMRLAVRA